MKKRIYLLLLSVTVIFFSCKDNSEFVEQLFTDNEISIALRQCIDSAAFYTCNALCVVDSGLNPKLGYNYYDSKSYRIELPAAAKNIVDTILAYATDEMDSLRINSLKDNIIYIMNRAAEQCGNNLMRQFWKPTSDSTKFPKPNAILRGGDDAITNFVKQNYQTEFILVLVNSILKEQFDSLQVITTWNELQKEYLDITGVYSSIDILTPAAQQMVAGFFRKMATEEGLIRHDAGRRGSPNGLFYRVFNY